MCFADDYFSSFQNKCITTATVLLFSICGARLVTAIRAVLVKGRSSGDAVYAAAEETATELKERIRQLHQIQKQAVNGSGTGISPARVDITSVLQPVGYGLHILAEATSLSVSQVYESWSPTDWCGVVVVLQPKIYAINHATAYGGRDTVKVLMAMLDEEALAPPWQNKADLLSEDQPVLNGAEGTCILTLFRLAP